MEEVIERSTIGLFGTIASFSLQNVDALASIIAAVLTSIFMIISISKVLKR